MASCIPPLYGRVGAGRGGCVRRSRTKFLLVFCIAERSSVFRRFLFFKRGGTLRNTVDCRFRTCDLPKRSPKRGQRSLGSGAPSVDQHRFVYSRKTPMAQEHTTRCTYGWYIAFVRSTVVLLWGIFSERFTLWALPCGLVYRVISTSSFSMHAHTQHQRRTYAAFLELLNQCRGLARALIRSSSVGVLSSAT